MEAAVGSGAAGQNRKKVAVTEKRMAIMLIGIPIQRGMLNRAVGSGSRSSFFRSMQEMTTTYELKSAAAEMDRMILKARVLPMMIKATRQVMTMVTKTAFIGTPDLGRTLERNLWNGSPLSREKDQICLELVVTALTAQKKYMMIMRAEKTMAAALDLVILWMSAIHGWPVAESRRSSTLPRFIINVTMVLNPRA